MAIKYTTEKHTVCELGAMVAAEGGRHIVSVKFDKPIDNGRIITVGKMTGALDQWAEADTPVLSFKGHVYGKGSNGLWLVVVDDPGDAKNALVYQKPLINEESPKSLTLLENFFNDPLDGPVRSYLMDRCDRFWLSDDGFSLATGVTKVTAGASIDGLVADKTGHAGYLPKITA